MSLNDLYQSIKKEKKDVMEKVITTTHATEIKSDIETLSLTLAQIQGDIMKLKESLVSLESLDMKGFTEKHTRMKTNYNDLVNAYNQSQTELKGVILDMSKRLNDMEAKLNL